MKLLLLLFGGVIAGAAYWRYVHFMHRRPQLLVAFMALAWPVVAYGNERLLDVGVNLHLRPLLMLLIGLPCLWTAFRYRRLLLRCTPWMAFYVFFVGWVLLYAVFFNAHAIDPALTNGDGAVSEGGISLIQITSYGYCLLAMAVSAVAMLQARRPQTRFDSFNRALILVSSLQSLITLLGFPSGLFCMPVDGFMRACGLFSHPNPYAHHMGLLVVYLTGLCGYYQGERAGRMPAWLLFGGMALNGVALLLGLSKTALGLTALCVVFLMLLLHAARSGAAVRWRPVRIAVAAGLLIPVALWGFQALCGDSFVSLLTARMAQTGSMDWRAMAWQSLLPDITPATVWLGHGLTAANARLFQTGYSDAANATPLVLVHNAYLAIPYDLGLPGCAMFVCALALCWQSLRGGLRRIASRPEYALILALSAYFLAACAFDEMASMFDAPMLYWMLCALLYTLALREEQSGAAIPNERRI